MTDRPERTASAPSAPPEPPPAGAAAESPVGLHRVVEPRGVLPQAAYRLDPDPRIRAGEVRVRVSRLNLDAASYRQLRGEHKDPAKIRDAVAGIVAERGKMHNPVTGSGGMLIGEVEEVGPESPLGLKPGDRIATLVSLTLTPLALDDGLAGWDGRSEQVPASGHAILFRRSIAARLPGDIPDEEALAVMDVCGAPALVRRVVAERVAAGGPPVVAVLGAAGKSGSLALAAAHDAGAASTIGVVLTEAEASTLAPSSTIRGKDFSGETPGRDSKILPRNSGRGLADEVVVADARDAVGVEAAVRGAGGPADVTVVCVDVPGCEHGAILATRDGGTVIFFSMATSFPAAALGAEGLAADVTLLIGNGYLPGHADYALDLLRRVPAVRALLRDRLDREDVTR